MTHLKHTIEKWETEQRRLAKNWNDIIQISGTDSPAASATRVRITVVQEILNDLRALEPQELYM